VCVVSIFVVRCVEHEHGRTAPGNVRLTSDDKLVPENNRSVRRGERNLFAHKQ
jgi:hypothetical protein